jgi:hypothetical protein
MNIRNAVLAALAMFTLGYSAASQSLPRTAGRVAAPAPLEGTWVMTINPVDCSTGDTFPGVPGIVTFVTFARGGTLTETNSSAGFEPGQRGPGHGYWERTGLTSYQFAYQAFIQFDSNLPPFRYTRGYQRLDQTLELHTDDEFTTIGSVRFFHGTSSTTPAFPSGCARSTGTRLF